ncbi:C2 and GRAM domain-containing protein At1g03370-like isoform X2 [Euphorbia lathyris]|uniref:C2 and GRAM domain-containing protein At1g03370-like isoform X2 n=1 Tax=Euphorbia lathyris TaxID=212925 RepID=UPI003313F7D4
MNRIDDAVGRILLVKFSMGLFENPLGDLRLVNELGSQKLQLGKQRCKTKVVKKSLNPTWGEEFSFRVEDLNDELVISVLDEDKYFNDEFVGQIKVPVSLIFYADNKSLGTAWYTLQRKHKKSKNKDCGINFSQNSSFADLNSIDDHASLPRKSAEMSESPSRSFCGPSVSSSEEIASTKEEKAASQKKFAARMAHIFSKSIEAIANSDSKSIVD